MKPDYESIRKEFKRLKKEANKINEEILRLRKIEVEEEAGKLSISPAAGGELSIIDTGGLSMDDEIPGVILEPEKRIP